LITDDAIGIEFTRLALWNHRIERILGGEEEIPVHQLHCVMALYVHKPSSARELADYLGVRDTSLSKLLKSLESRGAIQRSASTADRRIEHVTLTQSGAKIAERTIQRAVAVGNRFLEGLPWERREQFLRCLAVITSNNRTIVPGELFCADE
jgi:DNA-binding MarR family transcriptional regulator